MKPILRKDPKPIPPNLEVEFWLEEEDDVLYLKAKDTEGNTWIILSIYSEGISLFEGIESNDIPTDKDGRIKVN